jgi:hypothetical protein
VSLKKICDIGGRIARQILFLQQFDFTVRYKPGRRHTNADALSRIVHIPIVNAVQSEFSIDILKALRDDKELADVIESLNKVHQY